MRTKITPGLVATNGDGKPSVRPPIPASWCRPTVIPGAGKETDGVKSASDTKAQASVILPNSMSSPSLKASGVPEVTADVDGTCELNDVEISTNNDNDNMDYNENVESAEPESDVPPPPPPPVDNAPDPFPQINNNNDDANPVVVEENDRGAVLEADNPPHLPDNAAQFVEDPSSNVEVVVDDSVPASESQKESEIMKDHVRKDRFTAVEESQRRESANGEVSVVGDSPEDKGKVENTNGSSGLVHGRVCEYEESISAVAAYTEGSSESQDQAKNKKDELLDPVASTIASVAAGEGQPPEFLFQPNTDKAPSEERLSSGQHATGSTASSTHYKHKKGKAEKGSMSASARLPVISSLLAPSGTPSSSHSSVLPGIQHIAASRASHSPSATLPSVAHFLGPPKSPPTAYTAQHPSHASHNLYAANLPSTQDSSDNGKIESSHLGSQYSTGSQFSPSAQSSSSKKNSRKPVTPAGLRLSMAASEELPDPLPLPQYSEKVLRAKELGTIAFDRPTVLRETVQFFLQYKHYWSSHDYDRISNLVMELFPEFKEGNETPGVPANKRIRTDLSMYARNFRRREVSQRKKEGTGLMSTSSDVGKDSRMDSSTPSSGMKSFLNTSSPPVSLAMTSGNPSDFCNELLTAASIIESQNSSNGSKGDDMNSQMRNNNHHHKVGIDSRLEAGEVQDGGGGASHHRKAQDSPEEDDNPPIHFVYDKDSMAVAASRDMTSVWQIYSDQVAQAMAAGNTGVEFGMQEDLAGAAASTSTDRLSAMAMWRSTALPDPLPLPPYSPGVIRAREAGNTMSARPKIIRETTQFFLALKLWWTAPDYERIAELVLQNFPALVSLQAIKKDLGTCARNMRRRLPSARYKSSPASQKGWAGSQGSLESPNQDSGQATAIAPVTADYMKALMAAQNMNLTELGMTQRNLGDLAVLAGIKQRMEQRPQDVTDLERQYLAQCSTDEQRQSLIASGAFGNDAAAMAAISAFYGQLGVDITGGTKRGLGEYSTAASHDSGTASGTGEMMEAPNKRQRRISQAEVEKRLREAELSHNSALEAAKSHEVTVSPSSEKGLVKREPMSPPGGEKGTKHQHQQQHSSTPSSSSSIHNPISMPVFPSTSASHEQTYWDTQAVANMALMGAASMAHSTPSLTSSAPSALTQAHSQAHIQHLPGHDPSVITSAEAPMNLTYHESDKYSSSHRQPTASPLDPDTLPDTAGLAAQVEVTTSSVKSHSPRRRASSSPRGSQGESGPPRDQQVWFPHGAGFKKGNQEIVCLPDPLPLPNYSQKILNAREDGSCSRHRSEIIRETARFFLGLKYWWSSADYTRISELVVQHFPGLKDDSLADGMTNFRRIQRDLSMCARNLRRSKKPRKDRERSSNSSSLLTDVPIKKAPKPKLPLSEKRPRKSGSSRSKKNKMDSGATAVSEPSVVAGDNEDMTAAAALLQQQFMQSASSFHPSAHLLPSSHLLPSLHNHPSIQEQQMQALLQQQQQQEQEQHVHPSVAVEAAAKDLIKEEPLTQAPELTDHGSNPSMGSAEAGQQKSLTPSLDHTGHLDAQEEAKTAHAQEIDQHHGQGLKHDAAEKLAQQQGATSSSLKVYVDPDHGSDLQEKFASLWRKGKFFDASLGVANKKLHVHKLVLLAMSPYLQETFKNADPRSQLEVNLPSDTTYETAKSFLKYIYEGILEVDTSSVRSLHKIATMLQMTKLAQYCQNFAQQLHEGAGTQEGEDGTVPKISVNLGDLAGEIHAQRQKLLEAQALQRMGDPGSMSASDLQRAAAMRYHIADDNSHLKSDYLTQDPNAGTDPSNGNGAHFIQQEALAQHRALVAASTAMPSNATGLPSTHSSLMLTSTQDTATQQLIQAALARNPATASSSTSPSSSQFHHHQHSSQQQQQQQQQQQPQQIALQNEANASLLHRLTSPDSTVPSTSTIGSGSLDQQQRLALAAYWQAQTLELVSRNQVPGLVTDPSSLTAAELAVAAASHPEEARHLLSNLGGHEVKLKSSSRGHLSKEPWAGSHSEGSSEAVHQPTMLPETCLPADMGRVHQVVNNAEG